MANKQAKTLSADDIRAVLAFIDARSRCPETDRLKFLLSFRAGLRVGEIANLPAKAVLTPKGEISKFITVYANIAKYGRERKIPMHQDIAVALKNFFKLYPDATHLAVSTIGRYQSTNAVTVWFYQLYERVGLTECSSHSGRRTYLTQLARRASQAGCSLRDIQDLAGHARLETTARYIDPSPNVVTLVQTLGDPRFDDMDSGGFSGAPMHRLVAKKLSTPRKRSRRTTKVSRTKSALRAPIRPKEIGK